VGDVVRTLEADTMGIEEWLIWGVLLVAVLLPSLRTKEAVSPIDVHRLERKMDYLLKRFDIDPAEAGTVAPSDEVVELIRARKKIDAIKKLRQEARLTLREAKEIVDQVEARDRSA
jgi:hypothetical protein